MADAYRPIVPYEYDTFRLYMLNIKRKVHCKVYFRGFSSCCCFVINEVS